MNKREAIERREFPRHGARADTFVLLTSGHDVLGKLTDISTDGLSFEYCSLDGHEGAFDLEGLRVELEVFSCRLDKFILMRSSGWVVYDIEILTPSFLGIKTRRCGVMFDQLSHSLSSGLMRLFGHQPPPPWQSHRLDCGEMMPSPAGPWSMEIH